MFRAFRRITGDATIILWRAMSVFFPGSKKSKRTIGMCIPLEKTMRNWHGALRTAIWILGIWLGCAWSVAAAEQAKTLEIGSAAPDFNLPGVDGKDYSLK